MNKIVIGFLFGIFLTSSAFGGVNLTVGPEVSHISYREKGLPFKREIIDVKEDGIMYGIKGTLEYTDKIYLALDGKYSTGKVDYSGSGTIDDVTDYMIETRGLIGHQFKQVIIYSGYGYRYLNDDLSGRLTSTGLYGYERESTYHYVPIGVKFEGLQAELDILVVGEQVSNLQDIDKFAPEIRNKQNSGTGVKLSYTLSKKFKKMDLQLTPFFRWWKVQTSKTDDGFIEPKNTSIEAGGQVSVKF